MINASAIQVSLRIAGTKLLHLSHRTTQQKRTSLLKGTEERDRINPVMETGFWIKPHQVTHGPAREHKKAPRLIPHTLTPSLKESFPHRETHPGAHPANSPR